MNGWYWALGCGVVVAVYCGISNYRFRKLVKAHQRYNCLTIRLSDSGGNINSKHVKRVKEMDGRCICKATSKRLDHHTEFFRANSFTRK